MDKRKTSSFAVTCNRLGQYLKERKRVGGGGLGEVAGLEITTESTPRTKNLLRSIDRSMESVPEETSPKSGQMTIFYAGRVIVIDDLPEERVMSLMAIAGELASSSTNNSTPPPVTSSSDLPIARRASLSLFLDKRKYRVKSKLPYHRS